MKRVNPLLALVVLAVFVFVLFQLARWLFQILGVVAPFLLIAALLIKKEAVFDYLKWIKRQFQTSLIMGIVFSVLTVVGFPFVSLFVFLRAINYDRWQIPQSWRERPGYGDFGAQTEEADFEILDEDILILEDREEIVQKHQKRP